MSQQFIAIPMVLSFGIVGIIPWLSGRFVHQVRFVDPNQRTKGCVSSHLRRHFNLHNDDHPSPSIIKSNLTLSCRESTSYRPHTLVEVTGHSMFDYATSHPVVVPLGVCLVARVDRFCLCDHRPSSFC